MTAGEAGTTYGQFHGPTHYQQSRPKGLMHLPKWGIAKFSLEA